MKNSLQRITLTFILISLIPVGFVIYELTALSSNERMVNEAYRNQLDAILYSVNQYTDDVFSGWANKIDIALLRPVSGLPDSALEQRFLADVSAMTSVSQVYLTDLSKNYRRVQLNDSTRNLNINYEALLKSSEERIKKLRTYQRGGYRKMEALDSLIADRFILVYFLLNDVPGYELAVVLVDLRGFIQGVLAPKMQAVSQAKFVISAFDKRDNTLIYSTEDAHPATPFTGEASAKENGEVTNKDIWLLPGCYLGISMKDANITDLVKDRLYTSIAIFTVLFLLLVSAIIFLYRNVRKEILLSQAKSEFVSNVSHEIRTPLSLISMYAETLEMNRVPEEKKREYYSIITKETMRLSGIVNRILNFAQVDANKKKYEFRKIDLNELCERVLESYAPHLREKGFLFEFKESDQPLTINADAPTVSEALINLLDNAVKYSGDNKQIFVRTGSELDMNYVEVQDHGIGIPKVHQNHVFEQFYRVPTHDVHSAKGTGLGLTLVRKTMLAHKGRVDLQSTLDKGSTFRLSFPSALTPKEPATSSRI
jgi:two-component system, OmpR family, phosphate regulon sensor histidine kinase PhoR